MMVLPTGNELLEIITLINATGTVNFTNNLGAFCKANAVFGNQATAAAEQLDLMVVEI
jgi:hypothetical protein